MNSERFYKKAQIWARILGHLPGVRAIFLSGSVAQNKATENSDIDFFIIARTGRIWTARFFVFLTLKLCGQMRTEKKHAGKICPNHFITDTHLEIQEKDSYSANLFTHIQPLYDPYLLNKKFAQQNKHWISNFVGNRYICSLPTKVLLPSQKLNPFWRLLEKLLKSLQIKKIKSNPEYNLPDAKIVLEDHELRFHPRPKNKEQKHR